MNPLHYYMEMNKMKRLNLSGKKMINKSLTHEYLKWKLEAPDYYGGNLDALWDLLSTLDREIEISLTNTVDLLENLGEYGASLIQVFKDAEDENDKIDLYLYSGEK